MNLNQKGPAPTVPDLSPEDVRNAISAAGIKRVHSHNCSMCGYPCGWEINGDHVVFDSGCECTTSRETRPASFDDLAYNHNIQTHDIHRMSYRDKFGMK